MEKWRKNKNINTKKNEVMKNGRRDEGKKAYGDGRD